MSARLFCNNIYASYNKNKEILHDVSIDVKSGEFVALCGLNGSGKSTLLSLLAGLNPPSLCISKAKDYPSITNDNNTYKIKDLSRNKIARYISFMQQSEYSIWDFSVFDFILQGRFPYTKHGLYSKEDKALVDNVIEELSIKEFRDRNVHSLSGGEMQKVKIARCLAQEPLFIVLDEPSSNLDVVFEPHLLHLLKELTIKKNIGVLLSIHDINITSDIADKVCLLHKNGIISGSYNDVVTLENLKTTFGVDFQCSKKKYFQLLQ